MSRGTAAPADPALPAAAVSGPDGAGAASGPPRWTRTGDPARESAVPGEAAPTDAADIAPEDLGATTGSDRRGNAERDLATARVSAADVAAATRPGTPGRSDQSGATGGDVDTYETSGAPRRVDLASAAGTMSPPPDPRSAPAGPTGGPARGAPDGTASSDEAPRVRARRRVALAVLATILAAGAAIATRSGPTPPTAARRVATEAGGDARNDGVVSAITPRPGGVAWRTQLPPEPMGLERTRILAVDRAGGWTVVRQPGGTVTVVDLEDGTVLASVWAPGEPRVHDGVLVGADVDGVVVGRRLPGLDVAWRGPSGDRSSEARLLAEEGLARPVVLDVQEPALRGLDAASGDVVWERTLPWADVTSPAGDGALAGLLLVAEAFPDDGRLPVLALLDPADGEPVLRGDPTTLDPRRMAAVGASLWTLEAGAVRPDDDALVRYAPDPDGILVARDLLAIEGLPAERGRLIGLDGWIAIGTEVDGGRGVRLQALVDGALRWNRDVPPSTFPVALDDRLLLVRVTEDQRALADALLARDGDDVLADRDRGRPVADVLPALLAHDVDGVRVQLAAHGVVVAGPGWDRGLAGGRSRVPVTDGTRVVVPRVDGVTVLADEGTVAWSYAAAPTSADPLGFLAGGGEPAVAMVVPAVDAPASDGRPPDGADPGANVVVVREGIAGVTLDLGTGLAAPPLLDPSLAVDDVAAFEGDGLAWTVFGRVRMSRAGERVRADDGRGVLVGTPGVLAVVPARPPAAAPDATDGRPTLLAVAGPRAGVALRPVHDADEDGPRWQREDLMACAAPAVAGDDLLVVPRRDGGVEAVATATGTRRWAIEATTDAEEGADRGAAHDADTDVAAAGLPRREELRRCAAIVVGTAPSAGPAPVHLLRGRELTTHDARTGDVLARTTLPGDPTTPPVRAGELVLVAVDDVLHAIDPQGSDNPDDLGDGWRLTLPSAAAGPPVVLDDGTVVVAVVDGVVGLR